MSEDLDRLGGITFSRYKLPVLRANCVGDEMPPKERKERPKLQQKSPAEFFAENKTIAGFDSPGKSLYTTIRE